MQTEPIKVLIIGASKGIGLETTGQALAAGYRVRAFARSALSMGIAHPGLEKISGDALNSDNIHAALVGARVVIQTLGVGFNELFRPVHLFSEATRLLIDAMKARGVRRLICVTGFGAGESRKSIATLQRLPFQLVFGRAYEDKSRQERLIEASTLDWTLVRPGVLTGGPLTGRYRVLEDPKEWRNGTIRRADVAQFLVRQIEASEYWGKAPVLVQ